MTDIWSKEKRSEVMGRIRGGDTKPERIVRSLLHAMGYRFTVKGPRNRGLPGKPDIVLPRYQTVVFVHGCFWHRHRGCRYAYTPKSRVEWWEEKFASNVARDKKAATGLRKLGWKIVTIWECELKTEAKQRQVERRLKAALPVTGSARVAEKPGTYRTRRRRT